MRDFQLPKLPPKIKWMKYNYRMCTVCAAFRGTRKIFKLQNKQLDFRKGSSWNDVVVRVCQMPPNNKRKVMKKALTLRNNNDNKQERREQCIVVKRMKMFFICLGYVRTAPDCTGWFLQLVEEAEELSSSRAKCKWNTIATTWKVFNFSVPNANTSRIETHLDFSKQKTRSWVGGVNSK